MELITCAASETAQKIYSIREKICEEFDRPITYKLKRIANLEDAFCTFVHNSKSGWNGGETEPIDENTYAITYYLLQNLPERLQPTSIGTDPDGDMVLEWYKNTSCLLSVSISPTGELHYACSIGMRKFYGTEIFYGEIPDSIVKLISAVKND